MEIEYDNPTEMSENIADIVSAYVSNNAIAATDLPSVIAIVRENLARLKFGEIDTPSPEKLVPAVPIKKSVTDDFIICLEDGLKFQSMKRHLNSKFGMTPDEYRRKWDLPKNYPMVAKGYSARRSAMALSFGLGRNAAETSGSMSKHKRGRKPKAAGNTSIQN